MTDCVDSRTVASAIVFFMECPQTILTKNVGPLLSAIWSRIEQIPELCGKFRDLLKSGNGDIENNTPDSSTKSEDIAATTDAKSEDIAATTEPTDKFPENQDYLEFLSDGKVVFRLRADGIDNHLTPQNREKLIAALSYPPDMVYGATGNVPTIIGNYCRVSSGITERYPVFCAKPGQVVVNHLHDIQLPTDFSLKLAELSGQAQASDQVQLRQASPITRAFKNPFAVVSQLFQGAGASSEVSRWTLGNLCQPKNWADGLKRLAQKVNESLYTAVRMTPAYRQQFQSSIQNVERLMTTFAANDVKLHPVSVPPHPFCQEKFNAVWQRKSLSLSDGYSLNLVFSHDLPGKYQIFLKDKRNCFIYSSIYDSVKQVGYTRNLAQTPFERRMVFSLFDPALTEILDKCNKNTALADRNVELWHSNPLLKQRTLGALVQAVHQIPALANLMPGSFIQEVRNVYHHSLHSTAISLLRLSNGKADGFIRLADTRDPHRQYEIFAGDKLEITALTLNESGKVISESLLCSTKTGQSSLDGFTSPNFGLSELIHVNNLLYQNFVNTLCRESNNQPGYMENNRDLIAMGNTLGDISNGNLQFMNFVDPILQSVNVFNPSNPIDVISQNMEVINSIIPTVDTLQSQPLNPSPDPDFNNLTTSFSDIMQDNEPVLKNSLTDMPVKSDVQPQVQPDVQSVRVSEPLPPDIGGSFTLINQAIANAADQKRGSTGAKKQVRQKSASKTRAPEKEL